MNADVLDPATWDHIYYNEKEALEKVSRSHDPALAVRKLHARFQLENDDASLLEEIEAIDDAPARGLRLLILISLGQYDKVAESGYTPRVRGPLEMEEAMYAEWALSMACSRLGQIDAAFEHLAVARYLASSLGMTGRVHSLDRDRTRLRNEVGQPSEPLTESDFTTGTTREQQFSVEIHIAQLLAQGHYARSFEEATRLRAKTFILRLTAALAMAESPALEPDTPAERLASALDRARRGEDIGGRPPPLGIPVWDRYGSLLGAAALTQSGDVHAAQHLLPEDGPGDVKAMVAAQRWALWLRGDVGHDRPLSLPSQLREALEGLVHPQGVAMWLVRLLPHSMSVLSLAGWAHPSITQELSTVLRLKLGALQQGPRHHTICERATEALLIDGFNGDEINWKGAIDGKHRQRYRDKVRSLGRSHLEIVNPSIVYRLVDKLHTHVFMYGRPMDRLAVATARDQAWATLPDCVKDMALDGKRKIA